MTAAAPTFPLVRSQIAIAEKPPRMASVRARHLLSKPQREELKSRMEAIRAKLSAKSALAVAITYALKRWLAGADPLSR